MRKLLRVLIGIKLVNYKLNTQTNQALKNIAIVHKFKQTAKLLLNCNI